MDYQKKSSITPLIFFFFIIFIMVGSIVLIKYKNNKSNNQNQEKKEETKISREIEYTDEVYVYDISQNNNNFEIIIKAQDECDVEPCGYSKVDSYNITSDKEKEDLKELFNELFKNTDKNKLSLTRKDISIDQYSILQSVFKDPNQQVDVTYKIIGNIENSGITNQGYVISKSEDKVTITIAMGERSTGGYSIEITKIVANQDILNIEVKVNNPSSGAIVTQAFTTPAIVVELNVLPNTIKITSNNNVVYKEIKETQDNEEKKEEDKDDYKILDHTSNSSYKQKGYYVETNGSITTITIASGTKNTGGYTIDIAKITYTNNEAIITVQETKPSKDSTVIQAITYPIVQVEFKTPPTKINVLDEFGDPFELIK